jgi:hypothetical protein
MARRPSGAIPLPKFALSHWLQVSRVSHEPLGERIVRCYPLRDGSKTNPGLSQQLPQDHLLWHLNVCGFITASCKMRYLDKI